MRKRVCFFVSLCLLTISLTACDIFHLRGTVPDYEEETYTSSGNINSIVLCDTDVPVKICNSNTEKISLSYYNADDKSEIYEIEEDDGTLTVTKKTEPNYGIFIFGDQYNSDSYKDVILKLYIPTNYKGDLSVKTLDGNIKIENVTINSLSIDTNDGDVLLDGLSIMQSLLCKTNDGDIKAILNGMESEYNIEIKTNNGNNNTNSPNNSAKIIKIDTDDGKVDVSFSAK